MRVGVKVGPSNWEKILSEITPECVEVWFRLDRVNESIPIFEKLNRMKVTYGIHFWAILEGGYEPNLSYEPNGVAEQSEKLVRETIDIAYKYGAFYVNVHPGSMILRKLDLDNKCMHLLSESELPGNEAMRSLLSRAEHLDSYARAHNILFLIETLPVNELEHWRDHSGRVNIQFAKNIPPEMIIQLANAGRYITNDFGHTISSWVSDDRELLFDKLFDVTKQLAPQTKLIHLNTVRPPFNGTDSHDGILPSDFEKNVMPTREQIIQLLQLFRDRSDVWIIPEPEANQMTKNYREIKTMLANLKP